MNKSCRVMMLPTNDVIGVTLWINPNGQLLHTKMPDNQNGKYKGQHLYIVSDEDVVEGDYHIASGIIKEFPDKCLAYTDKAQLAAIEAIGGALKVIGSTNTSLFTTRQNKNLGQAIIPLPTISQSFVEYYVTEYNKGNVIDEVFVEYNDDWNELLRGAYPNDKGLYTATLKINPDNTLNLIIKDLMYWRVNAEELYNTTPIGVMKYISELEKYIENTKTKQEVEKIAKVAFRMGQQQPILDFAEFQKWFKAII